MKMDYESFAFTDVAQGGTLVDLDTSDSYQVGVAVTITGIAGTPATLRVIALAMTGAGGAVVGQISEHIRQTTDITTTGSYFLGYRGPAVGEIAFENIYKSIRVIADFSGGTSPKITGTVYIFRKRF